LKINCVATHSNGETVEIIIVVNKPAET